MSSLDDKELEDIIAGIENEELELKTVFTANKKEGAFKIAKYLIEKHRAKTVGERKREIYVYKDGVYVSGINILRGEIQRILEEEVTQNYKNDIIEKIMDLTVADIKDFKVDVNLINLNNKTLDIRTGELLDHNPNNLFLSKLPVDHKEGADCPKIKKFLGEIFDHNKSKIQTIQELFGYVLYREYIIKKAFLFLGGGDTGKTTLLNLLIEFIGKNNASGISLQQLCSDKFSVANLYGKDLNFYDDLPFDTVKDNGNFKIATGKGMITGEKKFYEKFQFINTAKLIFAANKMPNVEDMNDPAYFNRWIVIKFERVFDEDEQDKNLIHRLTSPEEMSGLLNFALKGLKRLLKNKKFSYGKDMLETKTEMVRSASTIASFAQDHLEYTDGEWISKEEMHAEFIKYAHSQNKTADTKEAFGGQLPQYADYLYSSKKQMVNPETGKPKQFPGWRNVRFKAKDGASIPSVVETQEKARTAPLISFP